MAHTTLPRRLSSCAGSIEAAPSPDVDVEHLALVLAWLDDLWSGDAPVDLTRWEAEQR